MYTLRTKLAQSVAAVSATCLLGALPVASADYENYALNGTWQTVSNGDWAQIRQQYHNVPTVRSNWTFDTTCRNATDCEGTVTSDQGWTAKASNKNGTWFVTRDLPDWEVCPDGTTGHAIQTYTFQPRDSTGYVDFNSTTFGGKDKTVGDSGNCGVSKWYVVEMPFTMAKVD